MFDTLTTDQVVSIAVLGVLAFWLLGSLLGSGRFWRNALVWLLIFGGAFAASDLWEDMAGEIGRSQTTFTDARVEVSKSADNHFRLTLQINEVDVDFLIDTGASQVVLTQADAARIGLDPANLPYIDTAMTANGEVATAPVRLDTVVLGDIRDTRVRASVNSGDMESSLLGMSYLSRFESIEIRQDMLILNR